MTGYKASNRLSRTLGLVVAIACLAHIPSSAAAQDLEVQFSEAKQMVGAGRLQEALERFMWLYENATGDQEPQIRVRVGTLMEWDKLTESYPPALVAMTTKRDDTLQRFLANPVDGELFSDLRALNASVGEPQRTLQLFEQLSSQNRPAAERQWDLVRDIAIRERRLDLLRSYGVDLEAEFALYEGSYARLTARAQESTMPRVRDVMQDSYNRRLVNEAVLLIETALALNEQAAARSIQSRALVLVPDQRIRAAIP
jgi:hypothetical protein